MRKVPRRTLFVLLSAVLISLVLGHFLKGMIVKDFQRYVESERLDNARPVSEGERAGSLENKFPAREKENVFIGRVSATVLSFSLLLTFFAFWLGTLFFQKPSRPDKKAVRPDAARDAARNSPVPVAHEITAFSGAETGTASPNVAEPDLAAEEEEPESEQDEEDRRPLAGDADRITKIVRGMEELAKAQALRNSLHKQPLDVAQTLNTIIEMARGSIRDKNVLFDLECESGLRLSADPVCLTGIMTHLLDNAAKAVKNDGTVTVSAGAEGDHVLLAVKDTGTGIRRKDIPHLFERFFRASGSGIGLGLTIVKELVDACGGTIKVETTRGKGSVITVRMPERIG
jgi:signal transduction histidine kinase